MDPHRARLRSSSLAAVIYFLAVFTAAFGLGTLRVLIVAPVLGAGWAVALELPLILALSWLASRGLVAAWSVPATIPSRLVMGGIAFALLLLAEFLLSGALVGMSATQYLASIATPIGLFGLAGQIAFALIPFAQTGLSRFRCWRLRRVRLPSSD